MERFAILNIWKSVNGLTPNIGFNWNTNTNKDHVLTIPKLIRKPGKGQTTKENCHLVSGAKIFNSLPVSLRGIRNVSIDSFKSALDSFLSLIPDEPHVDGLIPSTVCLATRRPSNKLVDVINRQKDKVKNFNDKLLALQSSRSHDITQGHSTRLDDITSGHATRVENISEPSTNEVDAPSIGMDASSAHSSGLDVTPDHSTRMDDIPES